MKLDTDKIQKALALFSPLVIYLFGSAANDRQRADSDVDVAFLPGRRCDPYEVFQTAQNLASLLGREVDLIDLSRASAVMKAQVIGGGQRLFVTDPRAADEFEMYALSDYARTNEQRREVLAAFAEPPHA